ncbi:MAG: serine/threonine protein kinase [Amphiamblys sp. WSBS2006]|nr:MAG: serine/threonine protein kinase [Amphiamblys sp. WSBS2006]
MEEEGFGLRGRDSPGQWTGKQIPGRQRRMRNELFTALSLCVFACDGDTLLCRDGRAGKKKSTSRRKEKMAAFFATKEEFPTILALKYLVAPLRFLGEGTYGFAIQARRKSQLRMSVIKVVESKPEKDIYDGGLGEYLPPEVYFWRRVSHKHVASFVSSYRTEKFDFIIGEYFGETDLHEGVKRRGFFPAKEAFSILQQLIKGEIHMVHRERIAHRDLKPSNILLGYHGGQPLVKIIDFGLASTVEEDGRVSKKMPGGAGYLSPECALGEQYDAEKSEVFTLGVVLYFMLHGRYPFTDPVKKEAQIEHEQDLLLRALETDPQKRPSLLELQSIVDRKHGMLQAHSFVQLAQLGV